MTKTALIVFIASAVLALAGLAGVFVVSPVVALIAIGLALGAGWLFAAWYYADPTPVLASGNEPGRVTFFLLLQRIFRGVGALTRPLWMRAWLNLPFGAVMAVDAVSMMQPELREAIFGNLYGGLALIALNLVARYGSTGAHAPVAAAR